MKNDAKFDENINLVSSSLEKIAIELSEIFLEAIDRGTKQENLKKALGPFFSLSKLIYDDTDFFNKEFRLPDGITVLNTIGTCNEKNICLASGGWNRGQNSFYDIVNQISICMKKTSNTKYTLIFTSSWDENDFQRTFNQTFNDFAKQGKLLAVVLVTSTGFSIQYLP